MRCTSGIVLFGAVYASHSSSFTSLLAFNELHILARSSVPRDPPGISAASTACQSVLVAFESYKRFHLASRIPDCSLFHEVWITSVCYLLCNEFPKNNIDNGPGSNLTIMLQFPFPNEYARQHPTISLNTLKLSAHIRSHRTRLSPCELSHLYGPIYAFIESLSSFLGG